MKRSINHSIAIILTVLFLVIVSAPTIITSIDSSVDISSFFGINEEEESEEFKIVLNFEDIDNLDSSLKLFNTIKSAYSVQNYPKPHLNLISPPPEVRF